MKDIKNILLLLIFIYLFYCSFLKCENFIFCNFSEISCDFNHDGKEPTLCPSPECDGCPNKCPDDCKFHICRRKDPTSYKAKESFLPYSLERNVNCDIGDYGAILQDIIGGRSDPFVLEYLCVKLKNVLLDENSFKEPFGGANVTLIMAIGQVLGGQGKLIPQLDCLIREVQKRYSFNKNCNFQGGNTCMDDYVIDASANAWRAVWEIKNGRIFGDIIGAFKLENNFTFSIISNAQDSILRSLSPDESICVRSNTELMQEQSKWVSKCLDSSYPLETLIKNGQAKVMNFNHVFPDDNFENPNYGVGLLSTLSTAFYGLKLAGHQFKLTDSFKKLLGRELFFNALNQINFDGTEFLQNCLWRTCQNSNPTSCFENAYCWDPYICDRDIKCGSSYNLSADLCNDPGNPGIRYHPQMYPIFDFLVSEFDLSYNTNSFKFDYFNGEYFKPQKDFFNDGRAIIYRNLGWEWPYKEKAPKLLGLPAMWVDVPPVPDASGQPAKICKGNFYGWVYTDEGANGTNRTSACAKIVDANSSCWTEPYPCENNNPSPVPISLVVKRDDVCEAYHNAFMDPLFYHDPSCNGVTDEMKIG